MTKSSNTAFDSPSNPSLTGIAKAIARKKLASGPARETSIMSLLGFRKFKKFTGTGFAVAKKNAPEVAQSINRGSKTEPYRSMWGIGLKVSRPEKRAVLSPNLSATTP